MCTDDVQDGNDSLSFMPAHFLHELDTREEVARTAGAKEEPVVMNEVPGHADSFSVAYPIHRYRVRR